MVPLRRCANPTQFRRSSLIERSMREALSFGNLNLAS